MPLPACNVPTHAEWKSLRNAAGGKEGLSKVNMGKKLDDFHTALKADDVAKAEAAIKTLDTAAKAYATEVKAKYAKLSTAVTNEIVNGLKTFQAAISAADKAHEARFDGYRKEVKQGLMTMIQTLNRVNADYKTAEDQMEAIKKKFKDGVPPDQAPVIAKVAAGMKTKLDKLHSEGWEMQQLGKSIEMHDDSIKKDYQQSIDVAIRLLDNFKSSEKWSDKLLTEVTKLAG